MKTEPPQQIERLAQATRVIGCLAVGWWILAALYALFGARLMATFKAGPNDSAAHGMVPADLQIRLIGWLLGAASTVIAVICIALLVGIVRGKPDAIYIAALMAMVGFLPFALVALRGEWFSAVTCVSFVLVIGVAADHWFGSRGRF